MYRVLCAMIMSALMLGQARAEDASSTFYKDKVVRIFVGYAAGSSFDMLARVIARFIGDHISGKPNVVVQNMPGASSLLTMNHIANVAPQDGTTIGAVGSAIPFTKLLDDGDAVKFEPTKMNWLPSPSDQTAALVVWHTVPINSIQDAREKELIFGGNAVTGVASMYSLLMNETLKLKIKVIYGFTDGNVQTVLAMERGEIHGLPHMNWNQIKQKPHWLREGKIKFLARFGSYVPPELANVRNARDFIENEEDRKFYDVGAAMLSLGRPYVMSEHVPQDRVAVIKTALEKTFADPAFRAAADAQDLEVNEVMSADEVKEVVVRAYAQPPEVIARWKSLLTTAKKK